MSYFINHTYFVKPSVRAFEQGFGLLLELRPKRQWCRVENISHIMTSKKTVLIKRKSFDSRHIAASGDIMIATRPTDERFKASCCSWDDIHFAINTCYIGNPSIPLRENFPIGGFRKFAFCINITD